MRVKLSLMGDMCMPQPVLLSIHEAFPCLELPTAMMWAPGFALQQNKLTKTVFHKSQFMALENHDCGYWIPHIWTLPFPAPPIALQLPLIIAFSKRKVMFSSSTVKAEDSQIAGTQINSAVALPMLTCGSPVPLPNSYPMFNWMHNVSVNLTVGDVIAGYLSILVTMVGEGLIKLHKFDRGPLNGVLKELAGASGLKHYCLKAVIGLAVSAVRLCGSRETEIEVEFFSAYLGGKVSIQSKRDGRLGFAAETTAFLGAGSQQNKGSLSFGGGKTVDSRSSSYASLATNESTTVSTCSTFGSRNRLETRQTQMTTSRGSVKPDPGGKSANSFAKTYQVSETATADGSSRISSGGFQGTSTAQGDWGGPAL
jgi:hypothetical protein